MRLYEISDTYRQLFDCFDECDELTEDELQAYFDTLEAIESDFDVKAESIACYIKELSGDIKTLEAEKKSLTARLAAKTSLVDRLKKNLLENMQIVGKKKIESPHAAVTLRNNPESVKIENEQALIEWAKENNDDLLNYKQPEISKLRIKDAVKRGTEVPYVKIEKTQSLIIK